MVQDEKDGTTTHYVDDYEREAREYQRRLSELTGNGRMSVHDAKHRLAVEDNAKVVQMNAEKQAAEKEKLTPAVDQPEQEQTNRKQPVFSNDREPHAPNYDELKKEHAAQSSDDAKPLEDAARKKKEEAAYNEPTPEGGAKEKSDRSDEMSDAKQARLNALKETFDRSDQQRDARQQARDRGGRSL